MLSSSSILFDPGLISEPRAKAYSRQQRHRCSCRVPKEVAHLLKVNPQCIAPAVRAFYARDPLALKKVHAQPRFGGELENMTVTFTRSLYARLKSQPAVGPPWRAETTPETDLGPAIVSLFSLPLADALGMV